MRASSGFRRKGSCPESGMSSAKTFERRGNRTCARGLTFGALTGAADRPPVSCESVALLTPTPRCSNHRDPMKIRRRFPRLTVLLVAIGLTAAAVAATPKSEIRIRDPFVLPDRATQTYYIYGTTTAGIFDGGIERKAVMVFKTKDLNQWDDPVPVWEVPADHWGRETVWAPEVHAYRGRYYLFVTITSKETLPTPPGRPQNVRRGTEILVAD